MRTPVLLITLYEILLYTSRRMIYDTYDVGLFTFFSCACDSLRAVHRGDRRDCGNHRNADPDVFRTPDGGRRRGRHDADHMERGAGEHSS